MYEFYIFCPNIEDVLEFVSLIFLLYVLEEVNKIKLKELMRYKRITKWII